MIRSRTAAAALSLVALASTADAQRTGELPRRHAPRPTAAAITPADLMTRLYVLADDSMKGREAGTPGNVKGTNYVAAQFRAIGLRPAGDNGTFFQAVPLQNRGVLPGAALSADGAPLRMGSDFVPLFYLGPYVFSSNLRAANAPVVFGGRIGADTITSEQARGKVVVLLPPLGQDGRDNYRWWRTPAVPKYPHAAAIAVASLDLTPPTTVQALLAPSLELGVQTSTDSVLASAPGAIVTRAAAERMLGAPLDQARPGEAGKSVTGSWGFGGLAVAAPARNVVGILPGSDPRLRGQYVVISAHNDHEGVLERGFDHDSVRAYNRVMRPQGANDPPGTPTPEQAARIAALRDSLRRVHGGVRLDSIMNGADDDGSGTVTLIEIAQSLASGARPRRSILFVSHTAEEKGLYGSQWFTDHPTVPRDSIVAALNMDMVGRGRAEDVAHGGPWSIQMIGSRRLSTQLGELIDSLNARRPNPMQVDYSFDAPGHPLNRYCRSDHFMYARYGIPITYFSLGYHVDYHQPSDEPQYIDYDHMARVGAFVRDIARAVANRPQRLVVDKPKPDPNAPCRQ